jgi:hypothetical protein
VTPDLNFKKKGKGPGFESTYENTGPNMNTHVTFVTSNRIDDKSTFKSVHQHGTTPDELLRAVDITSNRTKLFSGSEQRSKNVSYLLKKSEPRPSAIVTKCNPPEEICIERLPKSVYLSSRRDERNLLKLKNDYMKNKFDHMNFN